ncbi:MAG: Glycerol kinase [Sodalis sp.]|nr:MAG: Glycerol kinase [Sodalis sp.]
MRGYYLSVDADSASVRARLFSSHGERVAFATRPISQFHDEGHCVERSSDEIWTVVVEAIREAVTTSHTAHKASKARFWHRLSPGYVGQRRRAPLGVCQQ